MDGPALQQWLEALDAISYYDLFRVEPDVHFDSLRLAFHEFAETFHPDANRWRPPQEQEAIGRIYRRGTEAWRVLSDPALRDRYDDALARGILRPEELILQTEAPRSLGPAARLVDKVRSPAARPFVLRAEELLKSGDPRQAKIQLVLAQHMDANNPALLAFAKDLDAAISALPPRPARPGRPAKPTKK